MPAMTSRVLFLSVFSRLIFVLMLFPNAAEAHGGVVEEDDLCVINIGYLRAHFKIYVPQQRQHEEFCEDIPIRGESVFVMEYQHDGLSEAEIDFRIIENVTGRGRFARLEDVQAIDDIGAVTIRYEPAAIVPDVFTLLQAFDHDGEYIGIVSALRTDTQKTYTAVFPFEVGYTGIGVWPWILAGLFLLQFNYWYMGRRKARRATMTVLTVCMSLMLSAPLHAEENARPEQVWTSDATHFLVTFESELQPITINRIHSWILSVQSRNGQAVGNAEITVQGGMPKHDHGLPTEPRASENLGDGRYRIEGMRFHMNGSWRIRISIDDGSHRDDVTITLEL